MKYPKKIAQGIRKVSQGIMSFFGKRP